MALTYTQLVESIQAYLEEDDSPFVDNIDTFIRQSESRIYHLLDIPATFRNMIGALTMGNRYLTVPADFQYPMGVMVNPGGNATYLLVKDSTFIREAFPVNSYQGVPRFYGMFDDTTFILGPTPDQNYPVQVEYYGQPESIVDAGTSWLGNFAEEVLLYGCLVEAYSFLKGDPELLQGYQAMFQAALGPISEIGRGGKSDTDSYRTPQTRVMTK